MPAIIFLSAFGCAWMTSAPWLLGSFLLCHAQDGHFSASWRYYSSSSNNVYFLGSLPRHCFQQTCATRILVELCLTASLCTLLSDLTACTFFLWCGPCFLTVLYRKASNQPSWIENDKTRISSASFLLRYSPSLLGFGDQKAVYLGALPVDQKILLVA